MFHVAIVGAGGMAGQHARSYSELPNARVTGVMDIRKDAAEALAAQHDARAFTDFGEMLAAVPHDIVDVCVPTPWHAEYVIQAAQAKPLGIVVEKPMGRTVEDCKRIIAACKEAGVPLFPAHVLRFFPEFATARDKITAGAIGRPATVRTRRGGPFPRAWNNWYGKIDWSGGLIMDLTIHDFDWVRWTFGEVDRVYAKGLAAALPPGSEVHRDYALITLRFESGVMAHVEGTWADPGGFKVTFEVAGDEGLLEYNFNQPAPVPFELVRAQTEGGGPGVPVPESPVAISPYTLELQNFLESLESGKRPLVAPEDGLEAVRIAEAALTSARTGRPVRIGHGDV